MKNLLFAALIIMVIVFGVAFFSSSMASLDAGTDVAGSNYEGAYDDTTDASITVLGIISYVASIVGVAGLIIAVWFMYRIRPS